MDHDAAAMVRSFHSLAWTEGDLEAARRVLHDELVDHNPMGFPGRRPGADGLLQVVAAVRAGIPDLERTIEGQVADGDRVATWFTDRGTHTAELMGVPPSGARVEVFGMNVETVRDGRIAEVWHAEDLLGLMRQIGAL